MWFVTICKRVKWNATCIEQEYIRWYTIVQDNFIVQETKDVHKASYKRGWKGVHNTWHIIKNMYGKWVGKWQNNNRMIQSNNSAKR